jgi:hypothetical protein
MAPYGDAEFRIEYRDLGRPIAKDLKIPFSLLEEQARMGSRNARDFLQRVLNEQMIEPLLDRILAPMVKMERDQAELQAILGTIKDHQGNDAAMAQAIKAMLNRSEG